MKWTWNTQLFYRYFFFVAIIPLILTCQLCLDLHTFTQYIFLMYMFEQVSFKPNIQLYEKYGSMSTIVLRTNLQVYPQHYLFFRLGSLVCGQRRRLVNARNQWLFVQWTWIAHLIPLNRNIRLRLYLIWVLYEIPSLQQKTVDLNTSLNFIN